MCTLRAEVLELLSAGEALLEDAVCHAARLGLVKHKDQVVVVQRVHEDFCVKVRQRQGAAEMALRGCMCAACLRGGGLLACDGLVCPGLLAVCDGLCCMRMTCESMAVLCGCGKWHWRQHRMHYHSVLRAPRKQHSCSG